MRLVKSIDLVFENCEVISFDLKVLGAFLIDDIHPNIRNLGCNAIGKMLCADTVVLEIFKEGNAEYHPFQESTHKFDRILNSKDITQITVKYQDGEEDYWVQYKGVYSNEYQKNYLSKQGNLYIVIGKGKKLHQFFDKNMIDGEDAVIRAKFMMEAKCGEATGED